jgi:hypothetical protein
MDEVRQPSERTNSVKGPEKISQVREIIALKHS